MPRTGAKSAESGGKQPEITTEDTKSGEGVTVSVAPVLSVVKIATPVRQVLAKGKA